MSKKFTAATIILIAFGGIMIPGGFVVNNVIRDLTYGSVDEGLLGIKEQGIPLVKESVDEMGLKSVAISLALVKEMGANAAELLANTTMFMGTINLIEVGISGLNLYILEPLCFDWVNATHTDPPNPEVNFTGITMMTGGGQIKGISEWYGKDLNFTSRADVTGNYADIWGGVQRLKYGVNTSGWWGERLPGIFEDTCRRIGYANWPPDNITDSVNKVDMSQDRGFGLMEMIDLIEDASQEQILNMSGPNGYNLSNYDELFLYKGANYTKLEIFYLYLTEYYFVEAINTIIPEFNDLGPPSLDMAWGYYPQYRLRDWNGFDMSYQDITIYSIVEQWAKCNSYDDGADLHDSEPSIPVGTYGLEPAGPGVSTGIPMQAALQLWNQSNELSFTNIEGIYKWYDANSSATAYQELLDEFSQYPGYNTDWNENDTYGGSDWGFNETDMDLILDWLWGNGSKGWNHGSFYEKVFPELITDPACFRILLEQWAYGSIVGNVLYPDGFPLPLGSVTVRGFEIGYQGPGQPVIPTNMSIKTAQKLWDETNPYSLVSGGGLQMWFAAVGGDAEAKATLMAANGLSEGDMNLLLEWIPNFQHNVMPYLAQYQYGLPSDSITLGNILQVGGIGIGAAMVGIGSIAVVGKTITKRKRLNPFELGS